MPGPEGTSVHMWHYRDVTQRRSLESGCGSRGGGCVSCRRTPSARARKSAGALARTLHDELGQLFSSIRLELARGDRASSASRAAPEMRPVVDRLQAAAGLTDIGVASLRQLTTSLRPPILDHLGLLPAIRWEASIFSKRTGLRCYVRARPAAIALDDAQVTALYRILLAALDNIARHAGAGTVWIHLTRQPGVTMMEVRDNGRGITDDEINNPRTMGLLGHARARAGARRRGAGHARPAQRHAAAGHPARWRARVRKVLLVDDHPVVRQGISRILAAEIADLSLAEAVDGASALEELRRAAAAPGAAGPLAAGRQRPVAAAQDPPRVPVDPGDDRQHAPGRSVRAAGAAGRRGRLRGEGQRSAGARRRRCARRSAGAATCRRRCRRRRGSSASRRPTPALSDREYQVLRMIGAGRTVTEIGAELGLSVKTVSTYRARILEKLQLRTSAELIHYAVVNKLVP